MNWQVELQQIEDRLFPHFACDIWERGLYYYLLRRTRIDGTVEETITLSEMSIALRCSDFQSRKTVRSLAKKGCITLEQTRNGHRVSVRLPNELNLPAETSPDESVDIDELDFFAARKYVRQLVERESERCFYCLRAITTETCELDHVVSQMKGGDNSYKNIVASCHECNTKKQGSDPMDYLRALYRQSLLSENEFEDRTQALSALQLGENVPSL